MEIDMSADRKVMKADGKDISYISIMLIDKGAVIKNKSVNAHFYLSGDAKIVGFENATQAISGAFKTIKCTLDSTAALLILRAGNTPQIISITAMVHRLAPKIVKVKLTKTP